MKFNLGKPNSKKATRFLAAVKTLALALTGAQILNDNPTMIGKIWLVVYAIDFITSVISKPEEETPPAV